MRSSPPPADAAKTTIGLRPRPPTPREHDRRDRSAPRRCTVACPNCSWGPALARVYRRRRPFHDYAPGDLVKCGPADRLGRVVAALPRQDGFAVAMDDLDGRTEHHSKDALKRRTRCVTADGVDWLTLGLGGRRRLVTADPVA